MEFPGIIRTLAEARALTEQAFPRPPGWDKSTSYFRFTGTQLEAIQLRMAQQDNMTRFIEWLLGNPKIYKVARRELSYTAVKRLAENCEYLAHCWSVAYSRDKAPLDLNRLRENDLAVGSPGTELEFAL